MDPVCICRLLKIADKVEKVTMLVEAALTKTDQLSEQWQWLSKMKQQQEFNSVRIRPTARIQKILTESAQKYLKQRQGWQGEFDRSRQHWRNRNSQGKNARRQQEDLTPISHQELLPSPSVAVAPAEGVEQSLTLKFQEHINPLYE